MELPTATKEPMDPALRAHLIERLSHRAERLAKVARMAPSLDAVLAMMAGHVTRTAMVLLGETFAREMLGHVFDDLAEASGVCRFCHVRPLRDDRTMCQVCWDNVASDDEMTDDDLAIVASAIMAEEVSSESGGDVQGAGSS